MYDMLKLQDLIAMLLCSKTGIENIVSLETPNI